MSFFKEVLGYPYVTTRRNILKAFVFFKANPSGRIQTGIWDDPEWDYSTFRKWFMRKLNHKINRNEKQTRKCTDEYQQRLQHDRDRIQEYTRFRVRNRGCRNLLKTRQMQKRYPHINTQEREGCL